MKNSALIKLGIPQLTSLSHYLTKKNLCIMTGGFLVFSMGICLIFVHDMKLAVDMLAEPARRLVGN